MSDAVSLGATRSAYDAVAEEYAETFRETMRNNPFDRAMLTVFAELVQAGGSGRVADIGCGPGRVTALLHRLGLDVFGIDPVPGMLAIARRETPGVEFTGGALPELDLPDESLGGAVSRMSVIHLPPQELPAAFAEFYRVLAPGGYLYLEFFASLDDSELGWEFDHKVAPAWRLSVERTAALLREAGLVEQARLVEAPPETGRSFETAVLIYRKPSSPIS